MGVPGLPKRCRGEKAVEEAVSKQPRFEIDGAADGVKDMAAPRRFRPEAAAGLGLSKLLGVTHPATGSFSLLPIPTSPAAQRLRGWALADEGGVYGRR